MQQKTFMAKPGETNRKSYLIDADGKILGRVAAKAATYLRGKHKTTYTPHIDTGDQVIIINAEKITVTGKKMDDKIYLKYSGFHGGLKKIALKDFLKKSPTKVLEVAIQRMIPKGPLGEQVKTKLRVYAGDKHPHQSQKPIALEV